MTDLRTDDNTLPPIPDVPYVIGIAPDLAALHAIRHEDAMMSVAGGDNDSHRESVSAECGMTVVIARRWGQFGRGNPYLAARELCPYCTWGVALDQDTTAAEMAALVSSGRVVAL